MLIYRAVKAKDLMEGLLCRWVDSCKIANCKFGVLSSFVCVCVYIYHIVKMLCGVNFWWIIGLLHNWFWKILVSSNL